MGVGGEAPGAGGLGDQLGRGEGPAAGQLEQRRVPGSSTCAASSRSSSRERRSSARSGASAPADRTRALCSARARRRAIAIQPHVAVERAAWQLELGPQVVQMPAQPVLDPRRLPPRSSRWSSKQLDLERPLIEEGRGSFSGPSLQRRPSDGEGVDRIGLAALSLRASGTAISLGATRTTRSPRATRKRSSEAETWRQSSIAQSTLRAEPPRPAQQQLLACPSRRRPSRCPAARRSSPRSPLRCASACEDPPQSPSCVRPFVGCHWRVDRRRTDLSGGGATLLSSHAGDPRAAAGDTTGAGQSNGRHQVSESARCRPE